MTEDIFQEAQALRGQLRSVVLATVDQDGLPEASYAPYVSDAQGHIHVFVSALARHTQNLLAGRPASLLFIEDEGSAGNPFARRRLVLKCSVTPVARAHPEWDAILDRFAARFGKLIETLRGLGDFQLIRLTPGSGTYVRGFGQTFRLEGPDLRVITPVDPRRSGSNENTGG
jgi:hypothetical protein